MQIAVDAREVESHNPTGKGVWARGVIEELEKHGIDLIRITNEWAVGGGKWPVCTFLRWHFKTARWLKKDKPDLYLSPTSFIVPWLLGKKVPYAIVVHDLIAFENEPHDRKAKLIERLTLPRAIKNAKHIFTVSDTTKNALLKRFPKTNPEKVTTVYAGSTITQSPSPSPSPVPNPSPSPKYVLSISTLCPRKNQLRLIQSWNSLSYNVKKSVELILAGGRGWDDDEIVKLAEESDGVQWLGYVDDNQLVELMQNATVFAYPSLLEGFGIPVLDAMTLGIPVLTSNRSSLQEIAGDAALLINPESVDEITRGLERLIGDESLRRELAEKGKKRAEEFGWERTVDIIVESLKFMSC